jgi:2-desacetyl-2-hydroxyethyl bacteriochlorophyllide A dehydrogenase
MPIEEMTMKATYVCFPEQGRVTVETEDVSAEGLWPYEVVIRNETSIVSAGTELARLHGTDSGAQYPLRPGYGAIGRIEAKGAAVSDFQVGERVFYAGKHASVQRFLHGQNHQWGRLYRAPQDMDPVDAAFVCMAEIAMTAVNVTELDLGDTVAVFGLGLVGNLAAQQYRLAGARVIGLDPSANRCRLAREVGIGETVDAPPAGQVQALKEMTGGRGAQVTVDAVGHTAVADACIRAAAVYGQIVLLGTPRSPLVMDATSAFSAVHRNGLVVRGAHMWRWPAGELREVKRTVPWAFQTNFDLIASGRLRVRELLTHLIRPEQCPDAYRGLQDDPDNYVAVVIDWR